MEVHEGAANWSLREIEDVEFAGVKAFTEDGYSVRDIADEMGLSKSKVQPIRDKIKEAE